MILLSGREYNIFRIHNSNGLNEQIASIKISFIPKGVEDPSSYIAKQQHRLIQDVAKHNNEREEYKDDLTKADSTMVTKV